jgi:hypothetical protein
MTIDREFKIFRNAVESDARSLGVKEETISRCREKNECPLRIGHFASKYPALLGDFTDVCLFANGCLYLIRGYEK